MRNTNYFFLLSTLILLVSFGCVSKKKRGETSKFGKFYHNTTSYYNGYWNATELLRLNMINMKQANVDDFNQILEVEDYVNLPNPKMVEADMNKAIEKVIIVSNVHEVGDWVDDCYVLMAKAQYYKQDYETAETTLQYFQEVFNPKNPYGRNYYKSPYNKKKLKKLQAKQKKEEKKLKEEEKKEKAKEKEETAKSKEKLRKEKTKQREKERKQRAKEREKARKEKTKLPQQPIKKETVPAVSKPVIDTKTKVEETEVVNKKKEKKPEEDKTAYNEGLLWLAKTYIKRQNYFTAEFLLTKLSSTPGVQKKVVSEIPSTFASIYIKQGKYDEAIQLLQEAIKVAKEKELKARYSFIIGQLYEKQGNYAQSFPYFKTAYKKSKNYKMALMAQMAMIKNEQRAGNKSLEQTVASLEKMLSEEKFADQKHVIYYTIAQVELNNDNLDRSIENFRLSLKYNTTDDKLKADVYHIIASTLYSSDRFYDAKLYYDSTMLVMNKNDKRYSEVEKRAKNLVDIAKNLEIIQHYDTLLILSELTGDDQKKAIMDYAKRRSQETGKKSPTDKKPNVNITNVNLNQRLTEDFGTSTFFAYNKEQKEKGKEEFLKQWGRNIQLQDFWRQGSRARNVVVQDEVKEQEIAEKQKEREFQESPEYKNLMKEIPQSPVQKKEVQEKLTGAMFTLGKLYRTVLEKYRNSNEILEKMHSRFGPTQYELESYYHLVLNYRDLNLNDIADEYASKLIRKYPESTYAKILSDPEYFVSASKEAKRIDKYYEETYKLFSNGNYKIVFERIKKMKEDFGEENLYAAKIALMNAMCIGNIEGKDAYIKSLNDVIIAFPNTQEQTKAREILRFLTGDVQAFSTINEEESSKLYAFDETKPHFVAIVTYGLTEMQFVDVKISVSEFNKKYFKTEKLQMSDAMLNKTDNSQIVVIKKFNNAKEAMNYYDKVNKQKSEFITGNVNYEVLPISQQNYLKMLGQYSSMAYRFFFEKNYKNLK